MDDQRFDRIVKGIVTAGSRRSIMRMLVGSAPAILLGRIGIRGASAQGDPEAEAIPGLPLDECTICGLACYAATEIACEKLTGGLCTAFGIPSEACNFAPICEIVGLSDECTVEKCRELGYCRRKCGPAGNGKKFCNGRCVDITRDRNNCGGCGSESPAFRCRRGQDCVRFEEGDQAVGLCLTPCRSGETRCGLECCQQGARCCNRTCCAPGQECVDGRCQAACDRDAGESRCGRTCCAFGETCVDGRCKEGVCRRGSGNFCEHNLVFCNTAADCFCNQTPEGQDVCVSDRAGGPCGPDDSCPDRQVCGRGFNCEDGGRRCFNRC